MPPFSTSHPGLIASDTAAPVHIASVAVQVRPAQQAQLRQWLETQPGVEIHQQSDLGKMVVVMETQHQQQILNLIDAVHQQPGAINAALVYHEILSEESNAP